jgi:hypothetical protein
MENKIFKFDVLEITNFEIKKTDEKSFYNTDNKKRLNDWARHKVKMSNLKDCPQMSSALNVQPDGYSKMMEGGLGYMYACKNIPEANATNLSIFSSGFSASNSNGYTIFPENFFETTSLFFARKSISSNWKNHKDEYLAPCEEHEKFIQYKYDSLVYCLFNSGSNQSSLRQVDYKNQTWDIKNEFFWMSKNQIKELSDQYGYDNLHNDARTSSERYVYKLLFGEERIYDKLSPDAKLVLDKATELVEKSMELRQTMANDENHLDAWDAGYAQLKLVWKEYFQDDFKEFRQLYKNLEDRMRPLVYELGFLMK